MLILVPVLVVVPHLVPLPDHPVGGPQNNTPEFKDDGKELPEAEKLAALAEKDSIAFMEACLKRHSREVKGYTCTMYKQERINGKLEKPELVEVWFREQPHCVLMRWKKGERMVARALYVDGENKDAASGTSMVLVKPAGLGGRFVSYVTRDPRGKDARNSGRYTLDEFGLKKGLERTIVSWGEARDKQKALHVEFLGKKKIKELDDRECFVLKRTRYAKPEGADGVTEQILYFDAETWMLTGSILRNEKDELVAEYYFRDVRLNPEFDKDLFTVKSIEK
jgi:outer membrane lipoprotein-sorting protein